jgi:hypothetical protein
MKEAPHGLQPAGAVTDDSWGGIDAASNTSALAEAQDNFVQIVRRDCEYFAARWPDQFMVRPAYPGEFSYIASPLVDADQLFVCVRRCNPTKVERLPFASGFPLGPNIPDDLARKFFTAARTCDAAGLSRCIRLAAKSEVR